MTQTTISSQNTLVQRREIIDLTSISNIDSVSSINSNNDVTDVETNVVTNVVTNVETNVVTNVETNVVTNVVTNQLDVSSNAILDQNVMEHESTLARLLETDLIQNTLSRSVLLGTVFGIGVAVLLIYLRERVSNSSEDQTENRPDNTNILNRETLLTGRDSAIAGGGGYLGLKFMQKMLKWLGRIKK